MWRIILVLTEAAIMAAILTPSATPALANVTANPVPGLGAYQDHGSTPGSQSGSRNLYQSDPPYVTTHSGGGKSLDGGSGGRCVNSDCTPPAP